ncbi:MAG: IS1634 family transposase [Flavobacteriaceae bacterium]|nr:MAG: IS1634 family transposase [Flavobacteriaceae bacterium]
MLHVRVIKTKGDSKSVQVYHYQKSKRVIVKHIGSGSTEQEITALLEMAKVFIADHTKQVYLFEEQQPNEQNVLLSQCVYLGSYYTFLYDILRSIQHHIGYTLITDSLLNDLALMRIVEPASKLRSIVLMESYFGIVHRHQGYYESVLKSLELKHAIEKQTLKFAKTDYGFDFSMVFYDVTTLYFESFTADELRKTGFSKDGKAQQPQILVALLVTPQGFPVGYHVFSGNTFEGYTLIPVIQDFIKKHKVKHFTVVADAAMISADNIQALKQEDIHYIVGARLGNLSSDMLTQIDNALKREDGKNIRLKTDKGSLICSFSKKRYNKDKHEMNKQIDKAKNLMQQPSKIKKVKFIKTDNSKTSLNEELIAKTKMLLGVKGYYTDIKANVVNNATIIKNYHELYRVEQAFRVSKNDLKTRPIFHFKSHTIQLHRDLYS